MSATGNWKITLATPLGPQEATARLLEKDGVLTGVVESPMGSEEVRGTVSGNKLHWITRVSKPMPLDLKFDIIVEGDELTGTVELGMFGSGSLSGERV
ncbi:hypothetical protein WG907_14095 [Sphingobium sp. AN558]|uniref:hypothetical protein n=1 Tax=Sphingobium sp. AN558 TaxID=3133442 RepID=UPI0030BB22C2